MAGERCASESLAGTLGEPSSAMPVAGETKADWIPDILEIHPPLYIPGLGVGIFSPASFGMASETCFSSLSPAISAVWGILAPAFSPVLLAKRLDFFFEAFDDAAFIFLSAGNSADETPAISAFHTRRLVNSFLARTHMD